jgi:hypothetical protein
MAKQALKRHFQRRCRREKKNRPADDCQSPVRVLGDPLEIDPFQPAIGIKENEPISSRLSNGEVTLA